MAELEVGELAALRVGGERGEPVPVEVGEPQLGAGVRALLADDDPHPGRPGGKLQQPGDVRDPGPVPRLPVPVVGRLPGAGRDLPDRGLHVLGDRHADGVVQPPCRRGQPVQEPVRAAARIGADQDPPAQAAGQLRDREPGDLDVVGGGVRSGAPVAEQDREGLAVPGRAVVGEAGQGVGLLTELPTASSQFNGHADWLLVTVPAHGR